MQIDGIFARADADGSAEIDFEEFMVSFATASLRSSRHRLAWVALFIACLVPEDVADGFDTPLVPQARTYTLAN